LSSIYLLLNIWTSSNQQLLLEICAHFVNQSQETLSKALLDLQSVSDYSEQDQFNVLLSLLEDYNIVQKLECVVSNNVSSNDTLCNAISTYLRNNEKVEWNSSF
jgi:hypothetical protein